MKSCILGILKFSNGEAPARVEHVRCRSISGRDGVMPTNGFKYCSVLIAHLAHEFDTPRLIRTRHTCCGLEILG